jgi:hypothetical protein
MSTTFPNALWFKHGRDKKKCNENENLFVSLKEILVSPNLGQFVWSSRCKFSMRMKYCFAPKQILAAVSPNLGQ